MVNYFFIKSKKEKKTYDHKKKSWISSKKPKCLHNNSNTSRGSALLQIEQTRLNSTRDLLFDKKQVQAGKLFSF